MLSRIKAACKILFGIPQKIITANVSKNIILGKNSLLLQNRVEVREQTEEILFTVGDECHIEGYFYFENSMGKISIGDRTFIGPSSFISINNISIGSDVLVSWGCYIMDNDAHSLDFRNRINDVADWKKGYAEGVGGKYKDWKVVRSKPVVIKDKAWIGFNSIILKGITIGTGAVIAAGSVVTKDIPDFALAGGNPAVIIKYLEDK